MYLSIILWVIWGGSFIGALFLVIKKIPNAAQIDIKNMPEAVQRAKKRDIFEERLQRKIDEKTSKIRALLVLIYQKFRELFHKLYGKIAKLERHYKLKAGAVKGQGVEEKRQVVSELVEETDKFQKEENYSEAERKLIEAISLDNHNPDLYKKIAKLYVIKGDREHAEESLKFVLKLTPDDIELYCDLAEVLIQLEKSSEAQGILKLAFEKEPKNPKVLDHLIGVSIEQGDKITAAEAMHKLEEVNSDNQKLKEYKEKIDTMEL